MPESANDFAPAKSSCSPTARAAAIPGPAAGPSSCGIPPRARKSKRSGGERETTNNRMELTAVVRGLEALKQPSHVKLMTDSVYVGKGLSEWMPKWKANGWRRREGTQWKEVKNEDLWRRLDELVAQHQLDLHPRRRPQRPPRKRPLRRTGRGGLSAVSQAVIAGRGSPCQSRECSESTATLHGAKPSN